MAQTLDGRVAPGGKAAGIGGPADRAVMRRLRAGADAVMTGAGTLRAERVALSVPRELARERAALGKSPQPLAVTLTATGDLPLENLVGDLSGGLIILTTPDAHPKASSLISSSPVPPQKKKAIAVVPAVPERPSDGHLAVDLKAALRVLRRDLGVRALLAEGGPSLNGQLVGQALADELFFTLAPKLAGGPPDTGLLAATPSPSAPGPHARLLSAHLSEEGELLLRYRLARPGAGFR